MVEEINKAIRHRRSIYTNLFTNEPVSDEVIDNLLENANWAPTHKLTQPWRFIVFKDNGLQKLADFQSALYEKVTKAAGDFDLNKFKKLKQRPLECSHVIAIGMKRNDAVPEIEEVCAVAAAVQNMWLTASAYGLGCYWSTGGITFFEEAKPFFNLNPCDKLLGFMMIGHTKISKWPEGRRSPIQNSVIIMD